MQSLWRGVVWVVAMYLCVPVQSQLPTDPGKWEDVGVHVITALWGQGVVHDELGYRYFTSTAPGVYKTSPTLGLVLANPAVLGAITALEGYNHIGDAGYAAGKLYLPMECYWPNVGNTCNRGGIAVVDTSTLQLLFYVNLNAAEIQKAMWCDVEVSTGLLWTSSGTDLLAYRMSDIVVANSPLMGGAPNGISSVRRLTNVITGAGVTGSAWIGTRLFLSGDYDQSHRVIYSVDMTSGTTQTELVRSFAGEVEGIDSDESPLVPAANDGLVGRLHWQIMPCCNAQGLPYNTTGILLHYDLIVP
jgi:hypothetical protein